MMANMIYLEDDDPFSVHLLFHNGDQPATLTSINDPEEDTHSLDVTRWNDTTITVSYSDGRYEAIRVESLPEEQQRLVAEHHWNMLQGVPSYLEQRAHVFVQGGE
jgi:hypothetical protein